MAGSRCGEVGKPSGLPTDESAVALHLGLTVLAHMDREKPSQIKALSFKYPKPPCAYVARRDR